MDVILVLKINFVVTWGFTFFKYNCNKFKIISNIFNIIVNNPVKSTLKLLVFSLFYYINYHIVIVTIIKLKWLTKLIESELLNLL